MGNATTKAGVTKDDAKLIINQMLLKNEKTEYDSFPQHIMYTIFTYLLPEYVHNLYNGLILLTLFSTFIII